MERSIILKILHEHEILEILFMLSLLFHLFPRKIGNVNSIANNEFNKREGNR